MTAWPHIEPAALPRIWPSRYAEMMECRYREVLRSAGEQAPLPSSPRALLGTLAHRLIDDAAKGKIPDGDADTRFGQLVDEQESAISDASPDRRWLPLRQVVGFERLRARAVKMATSSLRDDPHHGGGGGAGRPRPVGRELRVTARGGKVVGFIDHAFERDGQVVLEDFKTGPVADAPGGSVKEHYANQLRLYAAMYQEDPLRGDGQWPGALEVLSISGERLSLPFTTDQCTQLLDSAVDILDQTNAVVNDPDADEAGLLATPSAHACRFCAFRPACSPYRAARELRDDTDDWPNDYWGSLQEISPLGNGTVSLTLETSQGPLRVRRLKPEVHTVLGEVALGDELAVFSAIRQKSSNTVTEGTFTTLIPLSAKRQGIPRGWRSGLVA